MINISKLDKAAVLVALFNAAKQQGMDLLDTYGRVQMTEGWASEIISEAGTYYDYLYGRVMKVDIGGDELDPRLYDRDNGQGAAQRALEPLLKTG